MSLIIKKKINYQVANEKEEKNFHLNDKKNIK